MKKNKNINFSLFLLLFAQFVAAQVTSITLQSDTSGYRENQQASSLNVPGSTLDYTLVPAVMSEMNTNASGALTYLIPVECLKGINNFQPNISLGYNSQTGNGTAGWGWNIIGTSVITKGGKSKETDGITIGIQFDDSDPYYLDGQRLLKKTETEYVLQTFSKTKITKSTGEYSFIVQYTDGKIAWYKEIISGQNYIVRISDAFNNEVHYTYSTSNNTAKLDKISYGGTDVNTDKFYINIIYKDRKFPLKIYRNEQSYINSRIISQIKTGSTYTGDYRKYVLDFDFIEANSTERLRTVTVFNESGDSLKPLNFNYNTSSQIQVNTEIKPGSSLAWGTNGLGNATVGNFSGTGQLEAIYQRKNNNSFFLEHSLGYPMPVIPNSNQSTEYFSGKSLINGRISERDQLIVVNTNYLGSPDFNNPNSPANSNLTDEVVFTTYDVKTGATKVIKVPMRGTLIDKSYVNYEDDPYRAGYGTQTTIYEYVRNEDGRNFLSGDFNNDGLIDFLVREESDLNRGNRIYFLEIGKAAQDITNPVILSQNTALANFTLYPIELNGDGISEFMALNKSTGVYDVYKINYINNSINKILADQILSNYSSDTPLFFGDFNGDGLTDFLTPQKVFKIEQGENPLRKMKTTYRSMESESLLWWKYTSDGKKFIKNQEDYTQQKIAYLKTSQVSQYTQVRKGSFWQKLWNSNVVNEYQQTYYSTSNIIISDFNGDGRSDIITLNKLGKAVYRQDGNISGIPIENMGNQFPAQTYLGATIEPAFTSNLTNRMFFYENRNLSGETFVKLGEKDLADIRISPLSLIVPTSDFNQLNTYKAGVYIHDAVLGSNIDVQLNNDSFLEKQIQEINNGSTVIQRIEYRPMAKLNSKEELCYSYKDTGLQYPLYTHQVNGIVYLVNKIHTLFSGKILTKEFRYENAIQHLEGKGFLGFQKTYVSDSYESTFNKGKYRNINPSKALFWTIQTKEPTMDNVLIKTTYGGINRFIIETAITNKLYQIGNQSIILATDELTNDYLRKIKISKKYIYDESDDLKLKKSYTDYNGESTSEVSFTYLPEFSNGQHYFYGKISIQQNTSFKDGLAFTTKEVSSFYPDNGSKQETKKYSQNSQPIITNVVYDPYGNIVSETLSTAGIASQTTTYGYDTTHRYLNTTTTADGLTSSAVVNALGRSSEETAALGNLKTYYTYDSWGNITSVTDYLGKTTTINKAVSSVTGGVYQLSKKRDGGTETIVVYDELDREILSKTQSINGKWVVNRTEYDVFGRKIKQSQPFFEGETPKWNTVEYDTYNRPVKNITYTGKVITTCYEGLKVTVDDGFQKTSKTLDATGNTVRHQDHGGVINYSYYPNGSLKETNYEGSKITFEIDDWGNKKKMVDPSAGTFIYQYDNLGRPTREDNPKGYTLFEYDDLGRPVFEKTYGNTPAENTSIEKYYQYNATTKLPQRIYGTSNGKSFSYTTEYDQYFRIKSKKEETPDFTYFSSTTFDSFGRADEVSISTTLQNPNYTTSSKVKNVYDANGILVQQNDALANTTIWHISAADALGRTTQMEYGNGYALNTYYNLLDDSLYKMSHSKGSNTVLDIDYIYNVNKGVLNSRKNNTFGKTESFEYDTLNRLLKETTDGVITNEYTYDKRGRMTGNTDLGQYNYNGNDYKLQNIAFNSNGQNINTQRGFVEVTYNAFKSPLRINLPGKDDLKFEYNLLQTRYRMYSETTGKQKLYSSDFAIEITKETNGKTQIVTYITGDPYSANYIEKVILNNGSITEKANYFLHRDQLNSILAVTKATDGSVVEKRFFDAWGNLKGLVNSAGQLITDSQQLLNANLFIDRGYTGHEHLMSVGLINMNARLYDPVMRRFLSPDSMIQDPFNTQNYNRFGYVTNNPLLYTDPSGNFAQIFIAMAIGVAISVTAKMISNAIMGIPIWYGLGKAAVMGAISSAVSFGIGTAVNSISNSITQAVVQAAAHAISGGFMSAMGGGNFESGAWAGAVSSLISSGIQFIGQSGTRFSDFGHAEEGYVLETSFGTRNPTLLKAIMITSGGLSGGISSSIAGGNFWDGFKQGLITAGLNHAVHLGSFIGGKSKMRKALEKVNLDPDREGCIEDADMLVKTVPLLNELSVGGGYKFESYLGNKTYGMLKNGRILVNIDKSFNNTLLDYAITIYHELRHHWFVVSGMYMKMRNDIGVSNRDILTGEDGFDEYQAAYSTALISSGENNRHYWNEVLLYDQHACYINKVNTSPVKLDELNISFYKNGGKY